MFALDNTDMRWPAQSAASRAKPAADGGGPSFTLLAASETDSIADAWTELAGDSLEANPFFSPWLLQPALRHLGGDHVRLLCLWSGPRASGQLVGLLPVVRARGYARLPVAYLQTWVHGHCFYGAPLMRRGAEKIFFAGLCAFVDAAAPLGGFLRLRHVDCDGPFAKALSRLAPPAGRLIYASGAFERAILRGGYDYDEFVSANIRKKKRKELKRQRNRLAERGPVVFRIMQDADDLEQWTALFMDLEDSGWKGANETSFKRNPAQAAFLREALRRARAAGALHFARIDVGGRPAAMLITFFCHDAGYEFKICHDAALARYSPGVMIEMAFLEAMQKMPPDAFIDSCAAQDHPMINSLWPERRRIGGINISGSNLTGRGALGLYRLLETIGERARA